MFGNVKGWAISGVIFALMALLLFLTSRVPPISEPTGKIKLTQAIAVPTDPTTLLPPMQNDCDAAELYRQAIVEYGLNERLYSPDGKYGTNAKALVDENPAGVQMIVKATDCSKFDLYASRPQQVVHYRPNWPDLEKLNHLGVLAKQAGMIHRTRGNLDEAERHLNASFALGYRLYGERVVWEELNHGLNLMFESASQLAKVANDRKEPAKAKAYLDFAQALEEYKKTSIVPVASAVTTIQSDVVGRKGGDIHGLLARSPERMWKVEALLALGRMKHNTTHRGDQIGAKRVVKQYVNDPDPAVREAAKLADELTLEKYRMIG